MLTLESAGARSEFRQCLVGWVREALEILQDKAIPQRTRVLASIEETSSGESVSRQFVVAPDVQLLVARYEDDWIKVPSTADLKRAASKIPEMAHWTIASTKIVKLPTGNVWVQPTLRSRMLAHYLTVAPSANFDQAAFDGLYRLIEQYFFSPNEISVSAITHVDNISLEVESVRFSDGVILRGADHDDIDVAVNQFGLSLGLPSPPTPRVVLESRVNLDGEPRKHKESLAEAAAVTSESALLSLRLIEDYHVSFVQQWFTSTNPFVETPGGWGSSSHDLSSGGRYKITADVSARLQDIWPTASWAVSDSRRSEKPSDPQRLLRLAISRLDDSYSRHQDEDMLIDYWVILEAIFIPEDHAELKYRASNRIAQFASPPGPTRRKTRDLLMLSYDLRSAIVHGADPISVSKKKIRSWDTWHEVVAQTGRITRYSLTKWSKKIMDGMTPNQVVDEIDDQMLQL
jgi:hypothetical protein